MSQRDDQTSEFWENYNQTVVDAPKPGARVAQLALAHEATYFTVGYIVRFPTESFNWSLSKFIPKIIPLSLHVYSYILSLYI